MEIINILVDSIKYFLPERVINALIVIAFIIYIVMWVIPKLLKWWKGGRNLWRKINNLLGIADELKKNGGTSIKDAIDRIEHNVIESRTDISVLAGKMNSVFYVVGEESGIAVFETNTLGEVIYACRRWTEISGLSNEESKGFGWLNAVVESDRERVSHNFNLSVEEGREFFMNYSLYNRLSELTIRVKSYSLIIRDLQGKPTRYLVVVIPNAKI